MADTTDNCDFVRNKRQLDNDADGVGDDCDEDDLIVSAVRFAADPLGAPWQNKSRVFWDKEPAASRYIVRFRAVDDASAARAWMCYVPDLQHYAAHWADLTRPYPGIEALVAALRQRGLCLAVLSKKPDGFTRQVVDHFFPGNPFQAVRGQLPQVPLKPDPTAARQIAVELGIPPGQWLYLGDEQ